MRHGGKNLTEQQTLFGFISLQTATELISLALVFNKVTGVYGLLAILTGYELSLLQLSTYVYSIAVLVTLVFLVPHIRKQSPFECLALAWLNIIDTCINAADTAVFGLEWYFATSTTSSDSTTDYIPDVVSEGMENVRQQTIQHGAVAPQETAASMIMIIALVLVRVYFSIVVMAYAQQVLSKYMQLMILEGAPGEELERDGPFGADLPDGDGKRGQVGRLMVAMGRGYWLDQSTTVDDWQRDISSKQNGSNSV
jgi:inositol phosphorylceramide synthase regulatory subunit